MFRQTDDVRIERLKPLIPPAILMEDLPITEEVSTLVATSREEISRILNGADDRLLVVVGP
jgi:3-deoxy-7-phosphoheptulonate synthase